MSFFSIVANRPASVLRTMPTLLGQQPSTPPTVAQTQAPTSADRFEKAPTTVTSQARSGIHLGLLLDHLVQCEYPELVKLGEQLLVNVEGTTEQKSVKTLAENRIAALKQNRETDLLPEQKKFVYMQIITAPQYALTEQLEALGVGMMPTSHSPQGSIDWEEIGQHLESLFPQTTPTTEPSTTDSPWEEIGQYLESLFPQATLKG